MQLYHISKLNNQTYVKYTASPNSSAPPQTRVRPLLEELLDNADQTTVLLSAKNLKDTCCDKIYIRKWLSDDEREKDKLLRDRYYKLNEKYPSNIDGKNSTLS